MNCTVCGNPLLYDRVVFHCSCGVYTHSYCYDRHVLDSHRPAYEIGNVNLDGEFKPTESREEDKIPLVQAAAAETPAEPETRLLG
jgi:hypothetical protein